MCGISGFINQNNKKIEEHNLDILLGYQYHRGPDHQGKLYLGNAGFAHNRLSLLDLTSAGNQPFQNENYVLVFNGEIYNFLQLKKELSAINYSSTSDTEVLFQALLEWGVDKTVKKLKGMFAFSWFNKNTQDLYLVRDRLGIKPLFYGLDTLKTLWFASEIKAILSLVNGIPDPIKVLYSSLGIIERSRNNTAWKDIKQVEPGTYIYFKNQNIEEIKYYSVYDTVNENTYNRLNKSSTKDVLSEFENLFSQSVKSMCISDAPIGAFVSGGVDSSIIAKYATENNENLKLFTANVIGKHSEFEDAKDLAKFLNKELFDYPYQKEMALRDWARVTWHYEAPIVVHFNAIPFSNVAKLAFDHQVKAVLTGEGSDELFLGYSGLITKRYSKFLNFPYTIIDSIYNKIPKLNSFLTNTGGSQDLLGVFRKSVQNYSNEIFYNQGNSVYNFVNNDKKDEHLQTAIMLHEHLVSLLWRNDRMGMIHSIESRFPFLDEDIIAFAMNLPTKFKIGKTLKFHNYKHPFLMDKYLVRKLAEKKLPPNLVNKVKKGFPIDGLRNIKVEPIFFHNGTIVQILQLTQDQLKYMCDTTPNYLTSILAAVEIWAKLFIEKKSIDEVDLLVQKYCKII
jgi:asparagine synthase (glutamine-hydrolysing)